MKYTTYDVEFNHTTVDSDTERTNRRTITVYGESEFAIVRELEKQNPEFRNITILEATQR